MSDKELKPCPFCGNPANEPNNRTPTKRPSWSIECKSWCVSMIRTSKKEVIEDWNTRADTH